ncbi:sigma-70 family RNA polymerase sigma factor [Saxibacter everestensis]|uniref:Sigma-70 family RNA polymerase sigma factor n=1 Tax=Saxibacter everestensis TaxID=2909229 RepID=A0ABY8QUN9_9MICO|nr:sigma-70 family RNA polymerase sigma factor [Brevibacteriaceae bacterium ZFBP1038]
MGLKPFEMIVAEHGPTILRVCRAIVGLDDAEDAWSETFLAAMKAYPELDRDANVEAWLVTIAKRKAIDQHRARERHPVPVDQLPDPVHHDEHWSDHEDLWQAMSRLPLQQREAVAYHHLGGIPYAEIGSMLGKSTEAARRSAADGIRKLRREVSP